MRQISDKLIKLVERHADRIVSIWNNDINLDTTISVFADKNYYQYIHDVAISILKNLRDWLSYEKTKEEIGRYYAKEGILHFQAGIPLCEISRAFMLLKKAISVVAMEEAAIDSAFELNQLSELDERIILFFDRAFYYIIRGYTEEMNKKMKSEWNLTDEDTEKVLFSKSFYNRGFGN